MYRNTNKIGVTTLFKNINKSVRGETIETKMQRVMQNKEPITDGAPITYTERKDGVIPDYDIRADRMEYAVEAMDKMSRQNLAKRHENIGARQYDTMSSAEQEKFRKAYPNNIISLKHAASKGEDGSGQGT